MKKINLFITILATFLLLACGGDEEDPGPGGGGTSGGNSFSATISGAISYNYSASGEIQGQKLVQASLTNGVLAIVSNEGTTGNAMTLAITNYDGAGTYSLDLTSGNTAAFTSVDTQTFEASGFANVAGSVEITLSGETINGTFNFDGEGEDGTIDVTNGEFSVTPE